MSPEIDRLLELDAKIPPGEWTLCGDERGGCQCMGISDDHSPICTVSRGDWGDVWHEIENGEVVQRRLDYGHIPDDIALATARFITLSRRATPKLARATKIALAALEDVESRLIGYGHSEEERQNNPLMKALAEIRKEIA